MEEIKISVIVPVYNAERFLEKCIRSIMASTLKEIEIICVNDGSKDKSIDILRNLEKEDNRIIVIDKENEGASKARNIGIDMAKGEYIAFVDSDDFIDDSMYVCMYDIAYKNNSDIVICGASRLDENYNLRKTFLPKEHKKNLEYIERFGGTLFNSPWNKLYKNSIIKNNNVSFPTDTHMGEDMVFNVKAFYFARKINVIKKSFYNYYDNLSSAVHTPTKKKEIYPALYEILNFFNEYEKDNKEFINIFNDLFIQHGVKLPYTFIENLRLKNINEWKPLLEVVEENINKNYYRFNTTQKIYISLIKLRSHFYFLKPLAKKLLGKK